MIKGDESFTLNTSQQKINTQKLERNDVYMKQMIETKLRNDLLERKEVLEEALAILEAETTEDHYLMLTTSYVPFEECLIYGWYEQLTDEEVENLEVSEGEDIWETYEDYLVSVLDVKCVLEEELKEIENELYVLEPMIREKKEWVLRERLLQELLDDWLEEYGDYIFFVGSLEDLEITMSSGEFCYLTEEQLEKLIEEKGGKDRFYKEYGELLIKVSEARTLFEQKLEAIKRKTSTIKYCNA